MATLRDELMWRGMVYDETEGLAELLATQKVTAYIGFDRQRVSTWAHCSP